MDVFNKYIKDSNTIKKVMQKNEKPNKILDELKIKNIDVKEYFAEIFNSSQEQDIKFQAELINEIVNRFDIEPIINSINDLSYRQFWKIIKLLNNSKLTNYVWDNLETLLKGVVYIDIDTIKILVRGHQKDGNTYNKILKLLETVDGLDEKVKLIDVINEDENLGSINDYLDELIKSKNQTSTNIAIVVLKKLSAMQNVDKLKLAQAVKNNESELLKNLTCVNLQKLLNWIKQFEADNLQTKQVQDEINAIKETINNKFEELLEKHNYNINLLNEFRDFGIQTFRYRAIQDKAVEVLTGEDLILYIQSCKGNEEFNLDWSFDKLVEELFKNDSEMMLDKISKKMISKILEELCNHENIGIKDLKLCGSGFYSSSIKIGKYVLKIGEDRKTTKIPNDRRILKPIIRQQANVNCEKNVPDLFIEVQDVVDADWYKGLKEEEIKEQLYQIFKEMMDRGVIWIDIKPENVGKLIKPNNGIINLDGLYMRSNNYAVSFTGKKNTPILQPGELVVIDTDYIYENDEEIGGVPKKSYYEEFYDRYEKEKKDKNNCAKKNIYLPPIDDWSR